MDLLKNVLNKSLGLRDCFFSVLKFDSFVVICIKPCAAMCIKSKGTFLRPFGDTHLLSVIKGPPTSNNPVCVCVHLAYLPSISNRIQLQLPFEDFGKTPRTVTKARHTDVSTKSPALGASGFQSSADRSLFSIRSLVERPSRALVIEVFRLFCRFLSLLLPLYPWCKRSRSFVQKK